MVNKDLRVSVVIPALNEEKTIAETIQGIKSEYDKVGHGSYEIIVVDDGSTDRTAGIAKENGATVVSHLQNMGYGKSLKDGIERASYDTIAILDADGTYPLERLPDLLNEYQKGFDMVVGERKGKNLDSGIMKKCLRWFLKVIVEYTAGRKINDINSGMRVFSKKLALSYFPNLSNAFSFTTSLTLAYMLNLKYVAYVPITYKRRVGKTKVRLLRDILRTLQYVVELILFYNPFKIFLLGFVFLGVASLLVLSLGLIGYAIPTAWIGPSHIYVVGSLVIFAMAVVSLLLGFVSVQLRQIKESKNT